MIKLHFFVYFWRESLFVNLVRYRMFPSDWVGYVLTKIVSREGVGVQCVRHDGGVVLGAQKLVVNLERFVPLLL